MPLDDLNTEEIMQQNGYTLNSKVKKKEKEKKIYFRPKLDANDRYSIDSDIIMEVSPNLNDGSSII